MQMVAAQRSGFSLGLDQAVDADTEPQHLATGKVRAYGNPLIKAVAGGSTARRRPASWEDLEWISPVPDFAFAHDMLWHVWANG
jgi:hypothetical protein